MCNHSGANPRLIKASQRLIRVSLYFQSVATHAFIAHSAHVLSLAVKEALARAQAIVKIGQIMKAQRSFAPSPSFLGIYNSFLRQGSDWFLVARCLDHMKDGTTAESEKQCINRIIEHLYQFHMAGHMQNSSLNISSQHEQCRSQRASKTALSLDIGQSSNSDLSPFYFAQEKSPLNQENSPPNFLNRSRKRVSEKQPHPEAFKRPYKLDEYTEDSNHSSNPVSVSSTQIFNKYNIDPSCHPNYAGIVPWQSWTYRLGLPTDLGLDYCIEKFTDVKADGHCGFRSIAVSVYDDEDEWLQVRQDMYNEIQENPTFYTDQIIEAMLPERLTNKAECLAALGTSADRTSFENWMVMPGMAGIVANRYKRPVIYYSAQRSLTTFPFNKPWRPCSPIVIGYHANHFFSLSLSIDQNLLIPSVCILWQRFRNDLARGWETCYFENIQKYEEHLRKKQQQKMQARLERGESAVEVVELDD